MTKSCSFIVFVSALLLTSCTCFEESESSPVHDQGVDAPGDAIIGKWKMVSSSGGFSGVGYGRDIDFLSIGQDSTFSVTRGTSTIATGKFFITYEDNNPVANFECLDKMDIELMLCNDREKYMEFSETDRLSLLGLCCDSYSLHFVRQN